MPKSERGEGGGGVSTMKRKTLTSIFCRVQALLVRLLRTRDELFTGMYCFMGPLLILLCLKCPAVHDAVEDAAE